jgi:FkbM family methyltransferase
MQIPYDPKQAPAEVINLWRGKLPHEDDFTAFGAMCGATGAMTLLDCGANAGQSAASFLMHCPQGRVVSFEPNPLYERVLAGLREELGAERFEFFVEGLSDRDETVDLHVPFVDDSPYLQEAAMDPSQFDKPWVAERLRSYGQRVRFEPFAARFVTADSKQLMSTR